MRFSNRKGITLIFVLWTIIILMIIGSTLSLQFRTNRIAVKQLATHLVYKQYVKNGMLLALAKIKQDTNDYDHPSERDQEDTIIYQSQQLVNVLTVEDVGSRLNVNTDPISLLEQVPHITDTALRTIQEFRDIPKQISHLTQIDPQYRSKEWSKYVTPYAPSLINVNTAPDEVLNILLTHLGFRNSEIAYILSLREDQPLINLDQLEEDQQPKLDQKVLDTLKQYLSFQTSFYKITSTLYTEDRQTPLIRSEAVVHKSFLSNKEAQLRVIYWVTVNYD